MNRSSSLSAPTSTVLALLLFAGIYGGGIALLYLGHTLTGVEHVAAAAVVGAWGYKSRPAAFWIDENAVAHELTSVEPTKMQGWALVHFADLEQDTSVVQTRHLVVRESPVEAVGVDTLDVTA